MAEVFKNVTSSLCFLDFLSTESLHVSLDDFTLINSASVNKPANAKATLMLRHWFDLELLEQTRILRFLRKNRHFSKPPDRFWSRLKSKVVFLFSILI